MAGRIAVEYGDVGDAAAIDQALTGSGADTVFHAAQSIASCPARTGRDL